MVVIPQCLQQSGIYCIDVLVDGQRLRYVGSSVVLRQRLAHHVAALRRGDHPNPLLQRYYLKVGEPCFAISILEYCPAEQVIERETYYVRQYNTLYPSGLNIRHPVEHGRAPSTKKGIPMSLEQRAKLSAAKKGKKAPPEAVAKRVLAMTGRPSPLRGRKLTEEHKERLRRANMKPKPEGHGLKVLEGRRRARLKRLSGAELELPAHTPTELER